MKLKFVSLLAALSLTACAFSNPARLAALTPGSSLADVSAGFGSPNRTISHADGSRTLEFSDLPFGTQCYMVKLDAAGKVVFARDMFADDGLALLKAPMTKQQVLEMICKPEYVVVMRTGEEAWDWNLRYVAGHNGLRLVAYFRGNELVRTEKVIQVSPAGRS